MKALSIRQPWAWLIAQGFKDIENRTWATRHRGPTLIHAAKGMTGREYEDVANFVRSVNRALYLPEDSLNLIKLLPPEDMERGGIVGIAELVDVVPAAQRTSPWHMEGCIGFKLANARPLPFTPYTGKLNFFDVPDDVLAAINTPGGLHG